MYKFDTKVQHLKYKVLRTVAKHAWDSDFYETFLDIPKEIISGKTPTMRCCVYKERAILAERVKLAAGGDRNNPNVIETLDIACDDCPTGGYTVTEACRGCIAHRCEDACPRGAITHDEFHHAHIDKSKCINCGKCAAVCPYSAIYNRKRPCQNACKIGAISMNEDGTVKIDNSKCISCGNCTVACPFSAISDVSMITDVIEAIRDEKQEVYACFAPSIEGQFGGVNVGEMIKALQRLGFADAMEVSLGADATAYYEAQEAKEVAREGGHMTTSCCPAFYNMVAKHYPALLDKVSHTVSPMVATARFIKKKHPGAVVVFIGPCIAKKSEVKRYKDAGKIGADYVLTFDELYAMFEAKHIDPEAMASGDVQQGSKYGKNFAAAGGVAAAVQEVLAEEKFDMPVSCVKCSGAAECKKALMLLRAGKLNETMIEGMVCEGGCVNGPAKITDPRESLGMRRQLMLGADDRSIADNLEMNDFKDIDMKDGRM